MRKGPSSQCTWKATFRAGVRLGYRLLHMLPLLQSLFCCEPNLLPIDYSWRAYRRSNELHLLVCPGLPLLLNFSSQVLEKFGLKAQGQTHLPSPMSAQDLLSKSIELELILLQSPLTLAGRRMPGDIIWMTDHKPSDATKSTRKALYLLLDRRLHHRPQSGEQLTLRAVR